MDDERSPTPPPRAPALVRRAVPLALASAIGAAGCGGESPPATADAGIYVVDAGPSVIDAGIVDANAPVIDAGLYIPEDAGDDAGTE